MTHQVVRAAELIAVLGTLSSVAYYALCLWSAVGFLRQRKSVSRDTAANLATPPVSILKPLRGADPEMYENFRSHCRQDYPQYEIIFGVRDPDDPAIELVSGLQAEFPERAIRLVLCQERLGENLKVSNLAQMLPHARHDNLVVNDSDIRVPPDYLRRVVVPLTDPNVGMVTCLYRGVAGRTLGSRLESIGISTDFCAGVLAARQLQGICFGLGSTLAFRHRDLEAIGGFEALLDYLADDYEIGNRIAARGLKVWLAELVVESFLPAYTLNEFLDHQLRWARTVRSSRPWGYLGLLLTFGLPWALLALILAQGTLWAWSLLSAAVVMRISMALVVGRLILGDREVLPRLWLIPFRDMFASLVWVVSYTGHEVAWRGDSFTLKDGKLTRIRS